MAMANDSESDDRPKTYAPHDWFQDGDPVVIRFMPEYSADVPLFPRSDDTDALVPEDLLAKLMRWQSEFDENFHWEKGWKSTEVRDRWAAEAVPLENALREALKGKADLVVDLWPLPWSGPRP
jgi:hypothetical protein